MTGAVFAVVICAALLHAVWNALVKGGGDKAEAMIAVVLGQGLFGLAFLPFAGPIDWSCWPYLLGSLCLHLGYQTFLIQSYRLGDLTHVYPIARGSAPLLVAVASVLLFGERFSTTEYAALGLITLGITSVALVRRSSQAFSGQAAAFALVTGTFIAGYSLVDGQGARIAGSAVGFFGTLAVLDALAFSALHRLDRPAKLRRIARLWPLVLAGGGASFLAYVMVVWAFTQSSIALVTALREVSIIFALLIGVGVMGERLDLRKVASTLVTLLGVVLLRLNRS